MVKAIKFLFSAENLEALEEYGKGVAEFSAMQVNKIFYSFKVFHSRKFSIKYKYERY